MNNGTVIAIMFGFAFAGSAMAAGDSQQTLAIQSAGQIYSVPQAAYQPDRKATYKVVFDLTQAPPSPTN